MRLDDDVGADEELVAHDLGDVMPNWPVTISLWPKVLSELGVGRVGDVDDVEPAGAALVGVGLAAGR